MTGHTVKSQDRPLGINATAARGRENLAQGAKRWMLGGGWEGGGEDEEAWVIIIIIEL